MNHFITPSSLETLSDHELRAELHRLFNALAVKQTALQEVASLQNALFVLQAELYKRGLKM